MLRFRNSISTKLFAAIMGVVLVIILFVAIIIAINMRSGFSRYLAQAELTRFDRLHASLIAEHDADNPGWPMLKDDLRAWRGFIRKAVPAPRPPPRRRPPRPGGPRPPVDPMAFGTRLMLLDASGNWVIGGTPNRAILARRPIMPIDADEETRPLGWLALSSDSRQVGGADALFLRDQLLALLATSLIALILSGIAAYWLARVILKPVRQLSDAGDRLADGDYSIRLTNDRSDEFGALLAQFNRLAESLDTRDRMERKWISDTSHELKTPLAVLRAQIEAIQDGVRKPTRKHLDELHDSIMRLTQLVADLNSLSNLREGQLTANKQPEDLAEIINGRLEHTLEHLSGKELQVESQIAPNLLIECDRLRLGQLFDNLLQNAVRYTDSPGKIRIKAVAISLREGGGSVEICIEDSPPCPSEEARDKLFDRFYREELSRDRRYGGSGLGLSICREIVAAHQGTISLAVSDLGGLKVTVTLPNR